MKVVQKVLSHGLLITFFVAVFLIYFYRVQLFPQWFGSEPSAEVVQQDNGVASVPAPAAAPAPAAEPVVSGETAPAGMAAAPVETVAPTAVVNEAAVQEEPVDTPAGAETEAAAGDDVPLVEQSRYRPAEDMPATDAMEPAAAVAETTGDAEDAPPVPEQTPAVEVKEEVFRPLETENTIEEGEASPVGDQPAATGADSVSASDVDAAVVPPAPADAVGKVANVTVEEQLVSARALFWNNDAESAEKAYAAIVAAYPGNADAQGELGNVYFKLGRWTDAADAFFRAANLLIDQGQPERAANMLRVLYGLDSGKGGELEERLKKSGALQDRNLD